MNPNSFSVILIVCFYLLERFNSITSQMNFASFAAY